MVTEKGEEFVFCRSDVCAVFPSCTTRMAGEAVRKAVMETDIEFKGVDFKDLSKYIAMNCTDYEISQAGLSRWVPRRAKRPGAKPGVTGAGVMGPHEEKNDEMWKFTRFEITPEVKRKLLAKGLEVAVKVMYDTHLYTFGGKVYHQQSGPPLESGSVGSCRIILIPQLRGQRGPGEARGHQERPPLSSPVPG